MDIIDSLIAKKIVGGGGGGSVPEYEGAYTATPSESAQTLECKDKKMTDNVSVGAISSTYIGSGVTQKAATTYTPTTSDQTIAANQYLAGAQTVEGVVCSNLTAGNIKKDVVVKIGTATDDDSVASVTGTYEGSGGGTVEAPMKDVNFYDYDGTRLYSYTAQEFLALTEMPENPEHSGLTAKGWNWSLANAKAQVSEIGAADIGQIYATDDGSTRIHIHLEDATPMKPYCGFGLNGTATIDWGDGSQIDTVTGTSISVANAIFTQHEYNSCGDYIINIKVLSGQLGLLGNSSTSNVAKGAFLFTERATYNYTSNLRYLSAVKKIEIGSNVVIGDYAFHGCTILSALSIPNTVTSLGVHLFTSSGIKCVIYPPSVTQLGGYGLEGSNVQTVSFSDSLTSLSYNGANNNQYFVRFILPNSLTNLGASTFQNTYTIRNLIIPSSVNTIGTGAVSNTSISYVKFCGEIPPSAGSSSSLYSALALLFPHNAASTYLVPPTNYPSPSSHYYIGFATFADQAALPTQDSTQAYNVVWYATKSDAIAQTNPITVGNGSEIYCRYTAV